MARIEASSNDFRGFRESGFQPFPGHEIPERIPQVVVVQTSTLIDLYRAGAIRQPGLAKRYFHDYTVPFLDTAAQGIQHEFTTEGEIAYVAPKPLEVYEATDYARVVFAWMHYFAISRFLPMGFSRRGMLKAPTTRREFIQRTDEIKRELALLVSGLRDPKMPPETKPSVLRMHNFFRVGSMMPLQFPDTQRDLDEKERAAFERLLGDANIKF